MPAEVDGHPLVWPPDIVDRRTHPVPAEALEEGDVRRLDVRNHQDAAPLRRLADREPNQRRSESVLPKRGEDGEPVALPDDLLLERIEPDCPARDRSP